MHCVYFINQNRILSQTLYDNGLMCWQGNCDKQKKKCRVDGHKKDKYPLVLGINELV